MCVNTYMRYAVVTTFHPPGLTQYAQTMIDTFEQYWPDTVDLYCYAENCRPTTTKPNVHIVDLHEQCQDLVAFKNKFKDVPWANGMQMKESGWPFETNNFKWDAVRFSNKVFTVIDACTRLNYDWVIWLDADSKTHSPVTEEFLQRVCPGNYFVSYLGRRAKYHSECGWVAYNLKHRDCQNFMNSWRNLYVNEGVFDLKEYHDSYVFDVLREQYQQTKQTQFFNLSPELPGKGPGHPFIASVLGTVMDHLKGTRRKELGHSLADDVKVKNQGLNQDINYWKQVTQK